MMCDISCEGLTGAPYKHCIEDPCTLGTLDADKVEVDLGSGKITLERTATGKFVALNVAGPLFGDAPVKAVVSSRTETGFFLAYDQSLEPPDPIDLKQPDPTSSLGVGTSDLKLRWTPGNGDFVLVEVAKDDPTVTDKVRCLLQDDGCHTMGACVLDWLEIKTDEAFRLSIIRVRGAVKNLDTNTAATLNLTSQLETTIIR